MFELNFCSFPSQAMGELGLLDERDRALSRPKYLSLVSKLSYRYINYVDETGQNSV